MDLGDFLRQVPSGLILMTCLPAILLVVMWSYFLWRRSNRRAKQQLDSAGQAMLAQETPAEAAQSMTGAGEAKAGFFSRTTRAIRNFFFYSEEEQEKDRQNVEATDAAETPLREPGAPGHIALPSLSEPVDAVEVLRVWRDVADGSLLVQIGAERYRSLGDMRAAGQERRFIAVLRELARMARESHAEAAEPAARAVTAPSPPPVPEPHFQTHAEAPPAPEPIMPTVEDEFEVEAALPPEKAAPAATPAQAPVSQPVPRPAPPPSMPIPPAPPPATSTTEMEPLGSFFDNVRGAFRRKKGEPGQQPALSVAEQIEEHLQYKLAFRPEYHGRSIHVRTAPDGGVRIQVDGIFYEGVGDIRENDVREFVLGVIREWEGSQ